MMARVLVLLGACLCGIACRREPREDPARLAALQATYEQLHRRLEEASRKDPAVVSALSSDGQLAMGIRSGLIEEIAGNLSRRYLDTVRVDLTDIDGQGSGEIHKDTFLGRIKVGDWSIRVELGGLIGQIRVGWPRVGLRGPNFIDVSLPVETQQTEAAARLHFEWDSASLANVVCRDFKITREVRGRVLAQKHTIEGSLRLVNAGESLVADPVVPDRSIQLAIDLTPESWVVVENALREQNTFGKCGTLIKPALAVNFLKDLGKRGVTVNLPRSIFRTVKFPGRIEEMVRVNKTPVAIAIQAERLTIETATLWSSASVVVEGRGPDGALR
jgi:hypothetical protein